MSAAAVEEPVTLISGTSRGIGLALAEHYLARGHRVVGCSRTESTLTHPCYDHVTADVSVADDARRVVGTATAHGGLAHLINNAGIARMNHALMVDADSARRTFEVNVLGTFLLCQEAARAMRRNGGGRIVNFSSAAVPMRLEGEAVYAASKAAVVALTEILARELATLRITVNAVGPGPMLTALTRGVSERKLDAVVGRQAIKRRNTSSDIANVVDFFLAPQSELVTGQVVYLGGPS